jgi:hypothetical protein
MRRSFLGLFFLVSVLSAQAQLVTPRSSASTIVIPAAGSVGGANGTFFRSDITLINYRNADQRVVLNWLPQNMPGASNGGTVITIPALSGISSEDFVANILHQTGLGAILITGTTAGGSADAGAQLYATARIWTPQPGSTGFASQSFPAISFSDINSTTLTMHGHRRDDRYRTNVGIVNLSAFTQTYQISLQTSVGTESQTIDVDPFSMKQAGLFGANSTVPLQIKVTNQSLRSSSWLAYASSVDNVTGDAWSSMGFTEVTPAP